MPRYARYRQLNRILGNAPVFLILALTACSSSPTSPLEISKLNLGAAYDVHVEGETAYVSNNNGIVVLDISDIDSPRRTALISESSSSGVVNFHISGDTLFTYGRGLSLYALGGGGEPQLMASFSGRGFIGAAWVREDHAFLAYLNGGLEVFDLSDPSSPLSVSFIPFSGQINDFGVVGNQAYLANSQTGLEVFDIENPEEPTRLGVVNSTSGAWDIHIRSDRLYLGCHRYGVKILDVSDPDHPTVLGSFNNGGETYGVFSVGSLLYTVDLEQGVEVLDVSTPGTPSLVMGDRNYHPHDVFSDGLFLYLADQDEHFVVLPLELRGVS